MRSPKRILAAFGATAMLTTALVGIAAAPASADPCPSGATCAYTSTNWAGAPGPVYGDNRDLSGFAKWRGAESIYNNGTSCNVYVYSGTGYSGVRYPLARGTGWTTLSGSSIWHHAYSNRWYGC
ncbi:hypothetical protein GCM10022225_73200 [Plantactinospora mayteni]|uniref:Peptidase inhibitor family I36 n=1 Tax=Plantactinospora mayteni TaxID=566021 RepID=A0ABQ4F1Q8_9ACTN|nr:peptidase inhibitor family I36 protein [Plantactinospora mayteni]GIH00775.1 hypothetical protein Pma05_73470 [Plantactinospora mayteni]